MLHLPKGMRFFPFVLLTPAFAMLCLFKLYPIVVTLFESFVVDGTPTLEVYFELFADDDFWSSLWITIKMNLVMIPLQIFLAFCTALLVNTKLKGINGFRTIYYLPVTISTSIACLVWSVMLNPDSGVINSFLGLLGISPQDFLYDKEQALWCIVLIATWRGVSYYMMFLLAGLKGIDSDIYEAAKVDGSGWLHTTFHITIPLLKRVFLFVFVSNTTANILMFAPMQMLTGGGPQKSTSTLMFTAYEESIKFGQRASASAIVTILLAIIVFLCLLQSSLLGDKDE